VPEAYEMVEEGIMTPEDFRDFMFGNPVRMLTSLNPDFFRGTNIESDVKSFLRAATGTGMAVGTGSN